MLIEFMNTITVDKKPFAENFRLNIQPKDKQLRLKVTYLNAENPIPVDVVVYKWTPAIDMLNFSIIIDGKEMTRDASFNLKITMDLFKRQLKVSGKAADKDIKMTVSNVKELLEVPKSIISFLNK